MQLANIDISWLLVTAAVTTFPLGLHACYVGPLPSSTAFLLPRIAVWHFASTVAASGLLWFKGDTSFYLGSGRHGGGPSSTSQRLPVANKVRRLIFASTNS